MQTFLGLCNYVRQWVFDYSTLIAPLLGAMKKAKEGQDDLAKTPEMQENFDKLKTEISNSPVLGTPNYKK